MTLKRLNNLKSLFKEAIVDPEKMIRYVSESIVFYNNRKKHSKLPGGFSPHDMESALYGENGNKHPTRTIDGSTKLPMLAIKYSEDDAIIEANNAVAMRNYKQEMVQFFKDWRFEAIQANLAIIDRMTAQHNDVVTQLDTRAANAKIQEMAANERYQSLLDKAVETQKYVHFLEQQAQIILQQKEQKEQKKLNKKNKKKQPVRQTVTEKELLEVVLPAVKGQNKFIRARRHVALMVMYMSGLRVSNLLLLSVGQLINLIEKGRTTIRLIKGGLVQQRHPIVLSYLGLKFFNKNCATQVNIICEGRAAHKPAFISQDDYDSPISEHTFERELNVLLKEASEITRKHLRTHSFRATFITDYLAKGVSIHEVQRMVGHSSLESTLCYNRSQSTIKDIENNVNKRYKLPSDDDPVDGKFRDDDLDDDSSDDDSPST